jgi:hypothetical protein
MTVASSTVSAWAAKGAMAVAKAATAAAFLSSFKNSMGSGVLLLIERALAERGVETGAKPETQATAATKRRIVCWKDFILYVAINGI